MKNKFLAIVAASAAALSGAFVSAPAQAQIVPGPNQNVTVNVTVPEILYLRTITSADVNIATTDLTTATLTAAGSGFIGSNQSTGSVLDTNSPFTTGVVIPKSISNAYAVWSNTPRTGGINVTVSTPGSFTSGSNTLPVAVNSSSNKTAVAAPGLVTPYVSSIDLDITPGAAATAGTYTGTVKVQVDAP